MKAREYLVNVVGELCSKDNLEKTNYSGAFLGAALAIMNEVESPLREEALVKLALIEAQRHEQTPARPRKRAA
ncbi:MAG: hypothetical protein ACK5Y6_09710 [Pseudomonadota bacterium]|jgi:hypothetical protein